MPFCRSSGAAAGLSFSLRFWSCGLPFLAALGSVAVLSLVLLWVSGFPLPPLWGLAAPPRGGAWVTSGPEWNRPWSWGALHLRCLGPSSLDLVGLARPPPPIPALAWLARGCPSRPLGWVFVPGLLAFGLRFGCRMFLLPCCSFALLSFCWPCAPTWLSYAVASTGCELRGFWALSLHFLPAWMKMRFQPPAGGRRCPCHVSFPYPPTTSAGGR